MLILMSGLGNGICDLHYISSYRVLCNSIFFILLYQLDLRARRQASRRAPSTAPWRPSSQSVSTPSRCRNRVTPTPDPPPWRSVHTSSGTSRTVMTGRVMRYVGGGGGKGVNVSIIFYALHVTRCIYMLWNHDITHASTHEFHQCWFTCFCTCTCTVEPRYKEVGYNKSLL